MMGIILEGLICILVGLAFWLVWWLGIKTLQFVLGLVVCVVGAVVLVRICGWLWPYLVNMLEWIGDLAGWLLFWTWVALVFCFKMAICIGVVLLLLCFVVCLLKKLKS